MFVKICGLTQPDEAQAIAAMGVSALGFIAVPQSPRVVPLARLASLTRDLPSAVDRVGVFQDQSVAEIREWVQAGHLTTVQLHGQESPQFCAQLAQALPEVKRIKVFRPWQPSDLDPIFAYSQVVDCILIDAFHPSQGGGTGRTVDQALLRGISFPLPWVLAGGLKPETIVATLQILHPDGIDLSSGVERAPGLKDLRRVQMLLDELRRLQSSPL
ncbi:MAG: phosphoribosylanthranilate isomerase [Synechococcaceae cyanobacterium SM2_3_1]|nr:phosphoribosylanthranilate isomerase [Synechococcaceae cyanobacterium SM2_3_1]